MQRSGSTEERRVFQSSSWLGPQPSAEPADGTAQRPLQTAATITGLEPYTEYAFKVSAENVVGSVSSVWISERTGESGKVQTFQLRRLTLQ